MNAFIKNPNLKQSAKSWTSPARKKKATTRCPYYVVALLAAGFLAAGGVEAYGQMTPSRSVRVGNTLYVSSAGNMDPKTGKQPEGVEASTRQVLANLKARLSEHGFTLADVVSSEVWINDLTKFADMNKIYREAFSGEFPTRTTIEVSALPHGSPVEIAMVAVQGKQRIIEPKGVKSLNLPFSPGILVGDTLFISGQTSVDPQTGKLIDGDIKAHVTQTLKNVEAILQAAEMDFSHIVQANVFLINPDNFGPMSEAYRTFTMDPRPARVPIGARKLPLNSPVEITMLAKLNKGKAILPPDMAPSENYSRGFLAGNELYVAGIGSTKESVQDRVDDCMGRVKKIVEAAGLSMDNVVMARIYVDDINDLEAVNQAYLKYFAAGKSPSQAIVAVPNLPANLKIMTSFVATKAKH